MPGKESLILVGLGVLVALGCDEMSEMPVIDTGVYRDPLVNPSGGGNPLGELPSVEKSLKDLGETENLANFGPELKILVPEWSDEVREIILAANKVSTSGQEQHTVLVQGEEGLVTWGTIDSSQVPLVEELSDEMLEKARGRKLDISFGAGAEGSMALTDAERLYAENGRLVIAYEPDVDLGAHLSFQVPEAYWESQGGLVTIPPVALVGTDFNGEQIEKLTSSGVEIGTVLAVAPPPIAERSLLEVAEAVGEGKVKKLVIYALPVHDNFDYEERMFADIPGIKVFPEVRSQDFSPPSLHYPKTGRDILEITITQGGEK